MESLADFVNPDHGLGTVPSVPHKTGSIVPSVPHEIGPKDTHGDKRNDENVSAEDGETEEEEFVLLDLDEVFHGAGLPSSCPYTLSGLDTMNPILTLGGSGLRLVGDYEETVGTCLVFTEKGLLVLLDITVFDWHNFLLNRIVLPTS